MGRTPDLTGRTFGKWTVLGRTPRPAHLSPNNGHAFWLCECTCGARHPVVGANLKNGTTRGCQTCANKINCGPGLPRPNSWGKNKKMNPKTEGESGT